jgi:NADH-quinone oxidoreductase subunit L
MALVMVDIKRVLAYSTISQLGFMMVSLGSFGYRAGLFHLMTHAFFKAMLFLGAGSVLHATEKMEFTDLGGLWRKMPITAFTFLIGALAMAGVPLFSGFFSKDEILVAVRDNQNMLFYILVVVAALMSSVYMARLTFATIFGNPRDQHVFEHAHESPWTMAVPLIMLGVLSVISGYMVFDWFGPLFGLSHEYAGVGTYLIPPGGHAEHYHAHYDLMISSTVVALAGLGIGAALYWQRIWSVDPLRARFSWLHRLLVNKYYMDDVYQWLIDRVVLVIAEFVGFFDRVVINDSGINGVGKGTILSGLGLRYHETGKLYNYGLVMIAGVVTIVVAAVTLMI